jgi:regulator of RNase E activity RraA
VVVGDTDGVAVVPAAVADAVAASVTERLRAEVETRRRLGSGQALDAIQGFAPYPYPLAAPTGGPR